MKKLLSILAAVTLTATASTSVVACGSSSTSQSDNLTANILQGGTLGTVSASRILNDIRDKNAQSLLFGDKGTALKTFLNYAAESFMKYSDKLKSISDKYIANGLKSSDADTKAKAVAAASYIDDGLWNGIKQDWSTRSSNAQDAWTQAQKDAKSKYGKKWESSWLKDLQSQFGEYVYVNGNSQKSTSYDQYKDLYISYSELNGESNGKSIADSLKDDIYLWGSAPDGTDIGTIKNTIMNQVFNAGDIKVGGKTINFSKANKQLKDATKTDTWSGTWLGEMKNFIDALNAKVGDISSMSKDDRNYLDDLINMINATGGIDLETQVKNTPTSKNSSTVDRNNYMVGDAKWASRSNIATTIKNWKDPVNNLSGTEGMAFDLIQRWDSSFTNDFNSKDATDKTDVSSLTFNLQYNVASLVGNVYTNPGKTTSNQINGLFSNAQRFVANDYYQKEKPVAVSEIVVKPLYSDGDSMDQNITNTKYVGKDANGRTGLMDSFYSFLGNFINNGLTPITGTKGFTEALVDKPQQGTSNYSWDELLKAGGKLDGIIDKSTGAKFTISGNVSLTSHANLLTRDSTSSDYSDLLKYSVYDYLTNGATDANKLETINTDKADDNKNPDNTPLTTLEQETSGDKTVIGQEYYGITNLVDSLNRGANAKSLYKVVNAKQGIIAFADKDGIHFVRIEGYGLLDGQGTGAKADIAKNVNVNDQSQLSVNNFKDDKLSDNAQDSYHAAQLLSQDLNSDNKDNAINITTDYMNSNDFSGDKGGNQQDVTPANPTIDQYYSGLKYDDLNRGFGNTYLKFLANSSIAKSNGASDAKYTYDLNSELKNYIGADITADNLAKSVDMLDMIWEYVKTITGLDDAALYKFVSTDGDSTVETKSLLFDPLRNTNLDASTEATFADLYEKYIRSALNNEGNRSNKALSNYKVAFSKADEALHKTVWTNDDPALADFHPSQNFEDINKKSGNPDPIFYQSSSEALDKSKVWVPYKTPDSSNSKAPSQQTNVINEDVVFSNKNISELKYQVKVSKFIPNDYALKGDEE